MTISLEQRPMPLVPRRLVSLCLALAIFAPALADEIDFNRDIRPILSENCFYCHGQDGNQRQADLRLDQRDAALDAGAFEPGDAEASVLVERIRTEDADMRMPPPDSNRHLSDAQKQMLVRWIEQGANYQSHWAYQAPTLPEVPRVRNQEWAINEIDRFVLAKLEQADWAPSPVADRATLIKRLCADLTGVPPTPEEVDAFVNDPNPLAYESLVDRLLASRHYGQRMALPWLDAARYADSNGFQQDGDTWQWMWRDWVVRALDEDLPFDKFTTWQLAGDLLPEATVDQKIASGFNRNHLLNGEGGAIPEEQRFNILFDRVDTTATNWLGLTLACAQCHDHKYDPMTQRDYYRFLDAFNHVPETGTPQYYSSRIRLGNPVLELPTEENRQRIAEIEAEIAAAEETARPLLDAAFAGWRLGLGENSAGASGNADLSKELPEAVRTLLAVPAEQRSDEQRKSLEAELRKFFDEKVRPKLAGQLPAVAHVDAVRRKLADYRADQIPRVMVMSDAQERDTHILERGGYLKPTEKVSFSTPEFLPPLPPDAPANRLGLAQWLMMPEHPLTARVQVNRMWQYFFGTGLVKTSEDFGVQSAYPLHKDLLDWLAVQFRDGGWSVKRMHRLIVTSATYRQRSQMTPEHRERDLENRLFARASRFRMPSLVLRDWALSASGLLNDRVGGAPVYPYQPDDVWEALAITKERDFTYPTSSGADLYRRSLYTFWRRTVGPANMFDASDRQACRVRATATSTPLHALTTLNDPTWVEAARVLAEKSLRANETLEAQIDDAFRRVLCRAPTNADLHRLRSAFERQMEIYSQDPEAAAALLSVGVSPRDASLDAPRHASLAMVCLAIMNLDEALTRE